MITALISGKMETLIGFLVSCGVALIIMGIGWLIDKLADMWHDRHFHRRKHKK